MTQYMEYDNTNTVKEMTKYVQMTSKTVQLFHALLPFICQLNQGRGSGSGCVGRIRIRLSKKGRSRAGLKRVGPNSYCL